MHFQVIFIIKGAGFKVIQWIVFQAWNSAWHPDNAAYTLHPFFSWKVLKALQKAQKWTRALSQMSLEWFNNSQTWFMFSVIYLEPQPLCCLNTKERQSTFFPMEAWSPSSLLALCNHYSDSTFRTKARQIYFHWLTVKKCLHIQRTKVHFSALCEEQYL